jgi:hypothetical protein
LFTDSAEKARPFVLEKFIQTTIILVGKATSVSEGTNCAQRSLALTIKIRLACKTFKEQTLQLTAATSVTKKSDLKDHHGALS